jgi:lipopolysaccharide export system protein LptC
MKIRIIGILLVIAILGMLYVLTEDGNSASPAVQNQSAPQSPSDADFKSLNIN